MAYQGDGLSERWPITATCLSERWPIRAMAYQNDGLSRRRAYQSDGLSGRWPIRAMAYHGDVPIRAMAYQGDGLSERRAYHDGRATNGSSEQVRLLHDPKELLLVHFSISIAVSFVDHLLKLLVGHALAKLLCHALQILEGDLSRLVIVKQTECLQDLILRVAIQDLVGHHLEELLVLDRPAAIVVDIGDHLLDLFLLRLEAEGTHGDLELLGVDGARAIGVEQVEGFFDLLLLLVGELLLLLPTRIKT